MRGPFAHSEMFLAEFKQTPVAQLRKEHPALDLAQVLDQFQSDSPLLGDKYARLVDEFIAIQPRKHSLSHESPVPWQFHGLRHAPH